MLVRHLPIQRSSSWAGTMKEIIPSWPDPRGGEDITRSGQERYSWALFREPCSRSRPGPAVVLRVINARGGSREYQIVVGRKLPNRGLRRKLARVGVSDGRERADNND